MTVERTEQHGIGGTFKAWAERILFDEVRVPAQVAPIERRARRATVAAEPAPAPVPEQEFDQLQTRLVALLRQQHSLPVGQINLIDLAPLKARLGDQWEHVATKVHAACEQTLTRHLERSDVHARYSDLEYLVVLGRLSPSAAQTKCAHMTQELFAQFLGDDAPAMTTIRTAVKRNDAGLVFADVSLKDVAQGRGQTGCAPKVDTPAPLAKPAPTAEPVPEIEFEWPEAPEFQSSESETAWEIPGFPSMPGESIEMLDAGMVELIYRPIWDVRNRVISTYHCLPCRTLSDGTMRYGYDLLPKTEDSRAKAWLDAVTTTSGLHTLDELIRNKFGLFFGMPVGFETLATAKLRDRYLALFKHITADIRKRLFLEMLDLPRGIPQNRIAALVNLLKPHSRAVFARTDLRHADIDSFVGTGVSALGADIQFDRRDETEVMRDIDGFVQQCRKAGLTSYVVGVTSTSLAVAAATSGAMFVSGSRVNADVATPTAGVRYDWSDFYVRREL